MHWQLSTYFLKAILLIAMPNQLTPLVSIQLQLFRVHRHTTLQPSILYSQSQQPPQQVALYPNEGAVNPGTSYGQASQFNHMTSGWNGQVANHVAPPPQQTLNYDDQSGALPPPPWEAQSVPSNEVSNGQLGGMQSHTTPMSQIGGMQPQHSMPGMQFAGMQPPLMPGAQQIMMYPQQMPGVQFGARPQQQIYGGQMAAYGYMQQPGAQQHYNQGRPMYGYPRTNDLSQKMYGLSMQDNSYIRPAGQHPPLHLPWDNISGHRSPRISSLGTLLILPRRSRTKLHDTLS